MSTSVSWCGFQIVGSRRSHAASGHEVKRQFFFLARMNAAACALLCAGVHVNAPLSAWRCLRVTGTAALSLHAQVQTERGREILPQTDGPSMQLGELRLSTMIGERWTEVRAEFQDG